MNINLKEYIKHNIVYLDGAMGSMLQAQGIDSTKYPERINLTHPDVIIDIHKSYFEAGSNIINTHTFGANSLKYSEKELDEIIKSAVENAKKARNESTLDTPKWIALDVGPTGKMLAPFGDFDFEKAVAVFANTIKLGVKYGVDLIFIETMSDCYETKAALLAAKENSDLPVFVSNSYNEDGKLLTGATPAAMIAMLEGMGADAIGINCSLGPKQLKNVINEYTTFSSTPIILKPNAGLPQVINGQTIYDITPDEYAYECSKLMENGVIIVGGCCGTTPEYINSLVSTISKKYKHKEISTGILPKEFTLTSSYTHTVILGKTPILIGERINPTGKELFKEALRNDDINYILNEGIKQQEAGAHVLDVNVGLPEIDEPSMLKNVVSKLQAITNLPLQIDTSNIIALEKSLRIYNGKAIINSVNGTKKSMESVFPLAKKYGGVIIALTLDDNGIPLEASKRFRIAEKILNKATEYGINKKDIIFDPLALAISTDPLAGIETLKTIEMITNILKCKTSLGISNVSFGLPNRDIINASFFTQALCKGLSAAIVNPFSEDIMKAYHTYNVLNGLDENCSNYIDFLSTLDSTSSTYVPKKCDSQNTLSTLQHDIINGLKEDATSHTAMMLVNTKPLDIINNEIIPALNIVGQDFEDKKKYLPQLLMSAEAAKCAFEEIKLISGTKSNLKKCPFVLATVKGDIHDIGKNIVKLILENYGYNVYDLGKDVDPELIVNKVQETNAPFVGLSALMTTTTPAMAETIKLLRAKIPTVKIIVGGAVLTKEYAMNIGADFYAKDALDTVKYAEENL